ncbi:MAG: hypothetical protein ABFS12_16635, partial [Bacteroidota bacterium]
MKKIDKEKILKSVAEVTSTMENAELARNIEESEELQSYKKRLKDELDSMKDAYKVFPNKNYLNRLPLSIIDRVEDSNKLKFRPSFAYAFVVALFVIFSVQVINFEVFNPYIENESIFNTIDIEKYLSSDQILNLDNLDLMLDEEIEFDYTTYLLNNSQNNEQYLSSIEFEILNL